LLSIQVATAVQRAAREADSIYVHNVATPTTSSAALLAMEWSIAPGNANVVIGKKVISKSVLALREK